MADLVRGEANSASNPRVVFGWQPPTVSDSVNSPLKAGFFQPNDAVSFRILDPAGTEYIASTVVDLGDDANLVAGTRLVALPFTIATDQVVGDWTVEVTFTAHPEGGDALDPQTVSWTFRVLDEALGYTSTYAQITDLLAQGFPVGTPPPCPGGYSLQQARRALERAARFVEEITGRIFEPRFETVDHDGQGGAILQFGNAICGLTNISLTFTTFSPADLPIAEGDVRVYNRHLRQRLVPRGQDDRQDPRIEFLRTPNYHFPRGELLGESDLLSGHTNFVESTQNVQVAGVWGYTDYDGSPFGKTPDLIKEATMRLAARYMQPLWQQVGGAGAGNGVAGPIQSERTLDQSVAYANLASQGYGAYAGAFTGDPEIDQILALYMAPPVFRSA